MEYLLQLKMELQEAFERDLAAVNHLIARLDRGQDKPDFSDNGRTQENGEVRRGRPATIVNTIRDAVRAAGPKFDLDRIMKMIDSQTQGRKISRKAISSGLARLAGRGELAIVEEGINGTSLTVYSPGEKFPPARS